MARSKVRVEWAEDYYGISCLKVFCKSGKLNDRDVYEALEHDYPGCLYIKLVPLPEDVPTELYDDGDMWILYEPYDIIQALLEYTGGEYAGKQRLEAQEGR